MSDHEAELILDCVCVYVWSLIAITKHYKYAASCIVTSDKYCTFNLSNVYSASLPSRVNHVHPDCSSLALTLTHRLTPAQRFVTFPKMGT